MRICLKILICLEQQLEIKDLLLVLIIGSLLLMQGQKMN